jgi:hypothetical protein
MLAVVFGKGCRIHIQCFVLLSLPNLWKGMTAVEACNSLGALVVLPLVALPEFFVLDRQGAARHFQNWERSVWNGRTSSL